MAEQVDFDWDERHTTRGRLPKYPWDTWLDGNTWAITRGEDFDLKEESLRAAVSAAARTRGLKARVHRVDTDENVEHYVIQALPDTD